ncbi:MAG TPA: hypothetical protein VE219_02220, partial [Candidatus Sulfotelmatobacter sp.]|nr:hypothetical protein [Candidatus Sulfotelmatobacter sp.]
PGGPGALTDIALALRLGRPGAAIRSWEVRPGADAEPDSRIHVAPTADDAVDWVFSEWPRQSQRARERRLL